MSDLRFTLLLLLSLALGCPPANDDDSAGDDDDSVSDDDDDDDDATSDDDDSVADDDDSAAGDDDDSVGDDDDSVPQTQCAIQIPSEVERVISVDVDPATIQSSGTGLGAGPLAPWDAFVIPTGAELYDEYVVAVELTFSPPLVLPGPAEAENFRIAITDWDLSQYDVNAFEYFPGSAAVQGSATITENALGFEHWPDSWAVTTYFAPADGAEIECVVIGWAFDEGHPGSIPQIEIQPKNSNWRP